MEFRDTRNMLALSRNMSVSIIKVLGSPVVIIDNFYEDPYRIRKFIQESPAPIWKASTSTRNFIDYYDCRHDLIITNGEVQRVSQFLEDIVMKVFGVDSRTYSKFTTNILQLIAPQKRGSIAVPHSDGSTFSSIIAMNTPEELQGFSSGTAIYRLKDYEGQDIEAYLSSNRLEEDGSNYFLEGYEEYWEVVEVIEAKFNRLVMFDGQVYHGAFHTDSAFSTYPRLNQVIFNAT